ncbi:hypothetical protein B1218_36905, partial [Pseudomonas ogarae]
MRGRWGRTGWGGLRRQGVSEGGRSAVRAGVRSSFILVRLAFTAWAFAVWVASPLSRSRVGERRFIGLAFAFAHLVDAALVDG